MSQPPFAARSILDLPDEPTAAAPGRPTAAGTDILLAARDALLAAFDVAERRALLDPFAPPVERNARVIAALRAAVAEQRRAGGPLSAARDDADALLALFADTLGWGPAQRYLDDPLVNEVKIDGATIMVQEQGRPFVIAPERFASAGEVRSRAVQLASALGVRLDAANPQETLPVAHGTRVHVTIAPRLADPDAALVCIRRGRQRAWDLDDVLERGSIDAPAAELLRGLCRAGCAFLIAGRTGSGKTGLLEALANSWPGAPHIITIEDHALEIGVRSAGAWTRELVDTQRDPQAFGRAAREALRQTPDLLLPGETRGHEAGAILALALSGHAVITTLHARTAAEAVTRFAGYAAQPGAYMYEGRHPDALRDACAAFDVVVRLDLDGAGRRLVAEVALLDGAAGHGADLTPRLVPLITAEPAPDGAPSWRVAARFDGAELVWRDGPCRTPAMLRERLGRLRDAAAAPGATIASTADEALARAEQLLLAGESRRALAALERPWRARRSPRLLSAARQALDRTPQAFQALRSSAERRRAELESQIDARRWAVAHRQLETILSDLALAAASAPAAGWGAIERAIEDGLAAEALAAEVCAEAELALSRAEPRLALDALGRAAAAEPLLGLPAAAELLRLREQALGALAESGDGSRQAALAVRERRLAFAQTTEERDR